MTEPVLSVPAEFYDALASEYDEMTGFEQRFAREKPFFHLLVDRYNITTAIDAGSGTGFHSLLLTQLGVGVTAIDVSAGMLRRLEAHAKHLNLSVKTVNASFGNFPETLAGTADAVFCLGNSLPHLVTDDELLHALRNFRTAIRPGGLLIVQLLNYDRLLADRTRIQSVKQAADKTFVRYYEYHENSIVFNVLTITGLNGHTGHRLRSIALRPLTQDILLSALEEAGFSLVERYGGITLEPFDIGKSKDCFLIAGTR